MASETTGFDRVPPASEVIEALDGIAYAVDRDLRIIALGQTNWNRFASDNSAPDLTAEAMLGRNLLDMVRGEQVRSVYHAMTRALLDGTRSRVVVSARCDGPAMGRALRLAITPIRRAGVPCGLLFHSHVTAEIMRPPLEILDFKRLSAWHGSDRQRPIVVICSFCQNIRSSVKIGDVAKINDNGETGDDEWITAERYYQHGGSSDVRLSHGMCPACEAGAFAVA